MSQVHELEFARAWVSRNGRPPISEDRQTFQDALYYFTQGAEARPHGEPMSEDKIHQKLSLFRGASPDDRHQAAVDFLEAFADESELALVILRLQGDGLGLSFVNGMDARIELEFDPSAGECEMPKSGKKVDQAVFMCIGVGKKDESPNP